MQSNSAAKVQKINDIHKRVCHFFDFFSGEPREHVETTSSQYRILPYPIYTLYISRDFEIHLLDKRTLVLQDCFAEGEGVGTGVEAAFDALHIEIQTAKTGSVKAHIHLVDGI